jgi:hypothetical protein
MPNPIKYSTGSETLALKKGNFYIGTGDVGKGPSDSTGYYQGPSPASGGYVIYLNKSGVPGNLSYHSAANDSQLISFTNNLAGTSFTSATQCLNYYATQTDKVCFNRDYEPIVTSGLTFNLDAGFTPSYSRSGTTWYDISGSNNGTLTNGPTFNSDDGGSIVFDGTDDYVNIPNGFTNMFKNNSYWTTSIWFKVSAWGSNNDAYPVLVSIGSEQGDYQELYLEVGNDNGTTMYYFAFAKNFTNGNTTINLNQVYNFVYMKDGGNFKIYKDGVLLKTSTGNNNISTVNGDLWIGRFKTGDFELNGNIYSTQIYDRALSDSEVLQNYNAQKGRFGL